MTKSERIAQGSGRKKGKSESGSIDRTVFRLFLTEIKDRERSCRGKIAALKRNCDQISQEIGEHGGSMSQGMPINKENKNDRNTKMQKNKALRIRA